MESPRSIRPARRVILNRPCAADETEYLALLQGSAKFHSPWFPERGEDAFGPAAFATFLASDTGERCVRFFIRSAEDNAIVGVINLNEIVRGVFQCAFLGYWIGVDYQGRGYMKEALELAIKYAFEKLDLHRLEANIIPTNAASLAVVAALGFEREGYSRDYLKIAGKWEDHERWATFRDPV